jgi:hypothetical protein
MVKCHEIPLDQPIDSHIFPYISQIFPYNSHVFVAASSHVFMANITQPSKAPVFRCPAKMGRQVSSDLVGGAISTPLENDGVKVSWDDDSQYIYIRIYIYGKS